jgi:hypothetical protein
VVAALVTLFELGAAMVFVLMLAGIQALPAGVSLATVVTAGVVFFLYMRRLLRHPAGATSCGCSPLTGPLTPASLVPSAGLVVAAVLGLASLAAGADAVSPDGAGVALSMCWGATLAMLVLLLPAVAVPQQAVESRS